MTQITEHPAASTTGTAAPLQPLLDEIDSTIKAMRHTSNEAGAELLVKLSLLLVDPELDRTAAMALFYRGNAGGRDTLGTLFYGPETDPTDGPMVAPPASRVQNLDYRNALISLHTALNALVPAENASLDEKRDFWEGVKSHLAPGQAMDDGQVADVTSADLNTVLKAYYGAGRVKKLIAYTDHPESLNFTLFNPCTVEGTKLEVRSSFRLNGEEPPVGAFSLRTMNGVVHFI